MNKESKIKRVSKRVSRAIRDAEGRLAERCWRGEDTDAAIADAIIEVVVVYEYHARALDTTPWQRPEYSLARACDALIEIEERRWHKPAPYEDRVLEKLRTGWVDRINLLMARWPDTSAALDALVANARVIRSLEKTWWAYQADEKVAK